MPETKLVHVIDDEDSIRRSLAFLLRTSGHSVQLWETGVAFLREGRQIEPGCVLLDIRMPEMDGLEVQAQMARDGITLPVIMLTGHGDITQAVRAMRAGAIDFLEKPFDRETLLQAIEMAFAQLRNSAARRTQSADAKAQIAGLTGREREVLSGLANGFPNKTIAFDLSISPRTVEVHRANLMTKLKVGNFADALRIAFAAGLGEEQEWRDIVKAQRTS